MSPNHLEFRGSDQPQARVISRVPATIRRIDQSRRDFQREIQSRRRLLAAIHEEMEHAGPSDPFVEDIERQCQRLYADYPEYRRQHGYPVPIRPQKRKPGK
jgi:two-component sensor histidine kinase